MDAEVCFYLLLFVKSNENHVKTKGNVSEYFVSLKMAHYGKEFFFNSKSTQFDFMTLVKWIFYLFFPTLDLKR